MAALIVESKSINAAFGHNTPARLCQELFVKQFLRPFPPPQIGIGTGEIINHLGQRSRQVDVVLYNIDRIAPALVNGSDAGVFLGNVIAVIEVKSRLTAQVWEDAHLNAYSVDQIYRVRRARPIDRWKKAERKQAQHHTHPLLRVWL
jgi:hypothetical protein